MSAHDANSQHSGISYAPDTNGFTKVAMEVTVIMNERFLTEIQVAERTRISLATLRRWRLEDRGPKFRKFGSLVRYDEDELNRWAKAQPFGGDDPDQRIEPQSVRSAVRLRRTG
jgi:predicted DNA-binding transcriptional regulator AlpA